MAPWLVELGVLVQMIIAIKFQIYIWIPSRGPFYIKFGLTGSEYNKYT